MSHTLHEQEVAVNNYDNNSEREKTALSSTKWKQKEFYISTIWPYAYKARTDEHKKKAIALCQEAGLNLVEVAFFCTEDILNYCDSIGINVLAGSKFYRGTAQNGNEFNDEDSIYAELSKLYNHQSIIGYLIWDEVPKNKLDIAKNVSSIVNKYDPARLAYSCLFPSYGVYNYDIGIAGGTWKDSSYYKYVDDYIKTVKPQVLSFDYYPFILDPSNMVSTRTWYRDMGLYRSKSLEYNLPFWYYIGSIDSNDKAIPRTQILYQLNLALAYGAKYISYFTTKFYLYDVVNFEKADTFEMAKALNADTMSIGRFLFDKTGTAIYHTGLKQCEHYNDIYCLDDISKSNIISSAPPELVISMFKDKNEKEYMMIVNKSLTTEISDAIKLKSVRSVAKFDIDSGKVNNITNSDIVSFTLTPGGTEIFAI